MSVSLGPGEAGCRRRVGAWRATLTPTNRPSAMEEKERGVAMGRQDESGAKEEEKR